MGRLTERDGKTGYAYSPKCFEACDGYCKECGHETDYVETLAAYEDTGHTPEQIQEFDALYLAKCREVNELRKRMQWIPVEERLPEDMETVLVSDRSGDLHVVYHDCEGWHLAFNGLLFARAPLAWMPLLEPYRPETAHNEPAWKQQMMNTFLGGKK